MQYVKTYTGLCILELSKVLIYELDYHYIKNKYGNNSRLLLTDIETEDAYEDFSNNK